MSSLQQYFHQYSSTHTHPINKKIHQWAVPAILFSCVGLLWSIPVPKALAAYWGANFASATIVLVLAYYFYLGVKHALAMAIIFALCVGIIKMMEWGGISVLTTSVIIFVVAWIFQFIGHHIEGKRPSFITDLKFLLIGPLWCLDFFFHPKRK